jgi:L-alanine-DL-glutamate epimerase-like enolase superfamily enzyme
VRVTETLRDVVTVPFKRPEIWAKGVRRGVTHVIVRVLTDEGAVGLGEYPALPTAASNNPDQRPVDPALALCPPHSQPPALLC